jgi:hypothetical protein
VISPDVLFIGAGVLATVGALVILVRGVAGRRRQLLLSALLWTFLAAGCFLQGFAPNLRVERNAFVIPVQDKRGPVNPRLMVERERRMKLLATMFLAVAAAGLFLQYRGLLMGSSSDSATGEVAS